jgi:hypothetical protein
VYHPLRKGLTNLAARAPGRKDDQEQGANGEGDTGEASAPPSWYAIVNRASDH